MDTSDLADEQERAQAGGGSGSREYKSEEELPDAVTSVEINRLVKERKRRGAREAHVESRKSGLVLVTSWPPLR